MKNQEPRGTEGFVGPVGVVREQITKVKRLDELSETRTESQALGKGQRWFLLHPTCLHAWYLPLSPLSV